MIFVRHISFLQTIAKIWNDTLSMQSQMMRFSLGNQHPVSIRTCMMDIVFVTHLFLYIESSLYDIVYKYNNLSLNKYSFNKINHTLSRYAMNVSSWLFLIFTILIYEVLLVMTIHISNNRRILPFFYAVLLRILNVKICSVKKDKINSPLSTTSRMLSIVDQTSILFSLVLTRIRSGHSHFYLCEHPRMSQRMLWYHGGIH